MSTVDKMLIKGIRSFDPENKNVITFFRPLTLIVGPNGAGKTTIIECLKLSCTGELPPNSRSGHSFIHDPKVAGETETKGQIKLRFKTAAGKDVVCIRSFQLTQKASKMEFKAIESVLQTINPHTGEKVCLSYRCADMDREIPALMGVSKAILENVIFVHQDDSNWPLQDSSTLKKKFDDIFSATRYTKALEAIKKLHKDQAQEIKTYKLKLENLQTLKDAAYKLRDNIAQDQEKAEFLKTQIKELERDIQGVEGKILHTETTLKESRKLQDQISTTTTARSTLFKLQQTQYAALAEENEDTDEELKEWQTKFEERIAILETKISKLEREMNDEETKSSLLSQTINDSTREIGKLQAEADAHMAVRQERDSTIQSIFTKHNLGSLPDAPFSNEVAFNLSNRIKTRLFDLEKDLQDKKKSNDMELKLLWEHYVALNSRCSEIEGQKQAKIASKAGIVKRMKEKENERDLAEHELSSLNLSHIDEREKNLQVEVERKTLALGERDYESTISQKRTEIFSLEQRIKALYREKDVLASDSEDRVKLDLKKEEMESCKRKEKKIMDEYKDRIRAVLKGRVPSNKDLKKEIAHALGSLKKEYDDLNSKTLEAEKDVKLVQMKIQDTKSHLSKLQKDMDAKRRFLESKFHSLILMSSDIESFPQVLLEALEKRDVQKSKYNIADGMRQMFDPFERVARAHHICPCCERPFSPEEEDEFVKKQRVKSASSAEHMKLLAIESSNADAHFQQLDKLRMIYEEYIKLGKETIPLAEKSLEELMEDLKQKTQAFDDLVGVLAHVKAEKDSVEVLAQPVETVDRLLQEMDNLKPQIEELEYKLDSRGQGVKSVEEIQLQLNALQSKRDSLNSEVENLREEQRFLSDDLSNMQMRWHALREEKLKASSILHKVKKADEDLALLAEEKAQVDFDGKHLAEALVPLLKEKEKLQQEHTDLKLKLELEYDEQAEKKRIFQQEIEMLLSLNTRIKEYLNSKKVERLKDLQEKHSLAESQLQKCESMKREISAELNKSKELLRNQDQLKRNIDDNLNYRKTKAEVDELTHEIESLEEKVLSIGSMSTIEAELKRHMQEKERLLSELNRCHGTLSVYQSNISKNKLELKQAQYNDIDKRYFNQLVQLKTTEMANKDLDRYYNALDKALMRFHTMKMEEINKIIRELWQQTYRGQDIDYISIHSDSEGAGTRSYSYKVLMQTGDAELEMRGRCSAGQKVLASLIIRLALAETFCLNCGILALDEPTTNLDGPNAESLAAALLRIMEDRKGQENFQLIVITHDERFAQLIGQRQHAERYYRVTKDEHQHSIIEAQEIFD
ncbi:DNA repair protein RAD50 isoform X1 [Elaeis guineensis]|uniref:DNA repair protein RAD50 n=1 Tax=Elaeis guineensis var. tenera TaxID=51953 RepID=A0A6I9RIW9_ELAGV|nr:DNA repair protein RAD50 isoform X1 [Elaeis guineensis]